MISNGKIIKKRVDKGVIKELWFGDGANKGIVIKW